MILRRIKAHIEKENWFAVGIDFLIVVVGVFIGLQVSNWNEARGEAAEYKLALERIESEIATNLKTIDDIEAEIAPSLKAAKHALDVLQSCEDSAANRQAVTDGLAEIRGTYGFHLRRKALDELTSNPRLLSRQSAAERQRFTDLLFYLELMQQQGHFAELHPLKNRIENNPIISVGPTINTKFTYFGIDFSKTQRPLILNAAVNEACRNDQLVKAFYTWEAWQDNLPVVTRIMREQFSETQSLLERRP